MSQEIDGIVKQMCLYICSYYNLDDTDHNSINRFLSGLVEKALFELESSYCLEVGEVTTVFGCFA